MSEERNGTELTVVSWGPVFAFAIVAIVAAGALAQLLPEAAGVAAAPAGYRWVTHANTALAGAAALYLTYYWLGVERVGQAASLLAAVGALGVPLGLFADAAQAAPLHATVSEFGLYEGTALFSAAAVFVYLAMERIYRNRRAALLIMPAVLLAVLCEMWLIAQGVAAPGRPPPPFSGYWVLGQRFAVYLGYGALAAAAACGAWVLLRDAGNAGALPRQAETIVGAAAIGAPMLFIGTGMGVAWMLTSGGGLGLGGASATLPALLAALALLAYVRWSSPDTRRLAWYAVAAFAVSTTGLLTGSWPGEALG